MKLACRCAGAAATIGAALVMSACGGHRAGAAMSSAAAPRGPDYPRSSVTRSFVLMLDGVPYSVMDSLHRAGHFPGFAAPSRVVSTFPSLTTLAFRDIWHEPPTPGYEDRYFDLAANRLRGGAWDVLSGNDAREGFQRHVNVEGAPLVSGLVYALPRRIAPIEYGELRRGVLLRLGRDSIVVAYSIATDAVAHEDGRAAQVALVLRMEELVDDVRRRAPGVRVDLFSDHGNDFVPSHRIPLEDELRLAGFHPTDRLGQPGDVVIPRFGLIGSVAVYAAVADAPRLARALAAVPGVDLAVYDSAGAVVVQGRAGRARVEADSSASRYRYTPEAGDPLQLLPALRRLSAAGELNATGFAPDSAWLRETLATPYEDSLRRLVLAIRGAVRNPATVLVSLLPGNHFGDPLGDALTRMRGTHGSLRTAGSTGFLMSTAGPRPPVLRSDAVLDYLPAAVRASSPLRSVHPDAPAPHGRATARASAGARSSPAAFSLASSVGNAVCMARY